MDEDWGRAERKRERKGSCGATQIIQPEGGELGGVAEWRIDGGRG